MNILVIGSANADLVIHTERMPHLGETIVGRDLAVNAGGKGLNQAVAIAKLGGDVSFLGAVGSDANGAMLLSALGEFGVNFVGTRTEDVPTGTAIITVVGGDNFIVLNAGANDTLTPDVIDANAALIRDADFIVLQLEIPMSAIVRACEIARDSGTKVILNPAPSRELPNHLYPMIDYLIPNEHEARDLTGITLDSPDACIQAIRHLNERGANCVIVTLGEQGCAYNVGEEIVFHPAVQSNAVDTTSAGDSFIGALVTKLAESRALPDAIAYAGKVAAVTVSRPGAAKSIPTATEINE